MQIYRFTIRVGLKPGRDQPLCLLSRLDVEKMSLSQGMIWKGLFSIGLLALALYAGFAQFPLWCVLLIGILFAIAYIQGKWYLWSDVFQAGGRRLYQSLFVTYLIQLVVVTIFYLLGSGVARLLQR